MAGQKHSRQRDCIKSVLLDRCDHPTADEVYSRVKEEFPNISLGTVYRNLSLLTRIGEILKINSLNGADRFDARTDPHDHFICRSCGCVMDVEKDFSEGNPARLEKTFPGGRIDGSSTRYFGICFQCLEKKTGAKEAGAAENPAAAGVF